MDDAPHLDPEEARCLGCLVEKAMTTPDQYPMSLNAVRIACNQVSNRDPVVDFDETTVERALRRLADKGLCRFVHRAGDRVVKYAHAAGEVLDLTEAQLALLAVLILRGTQTPGELRQRTARYVEFPSLAEVETTLEGMRDRGLLHRLDRLPGQKEHRYGELLGTRSAASRSHAGSSTEPPGSPPARETRDEQISLVRADLDELRARFERLLESLGVDDL